MSWFSRWSTSLRRAWPPMIFWGGRTLRRRGSKARCSPRPMSRGRPFPKNFASWSAGATTEPVAFHLEFSGNGSRAEHTAAPVAAQWGDRAVEVWGVNYPGYGRSTGPARLRDFPRAGLAVYDELAKVANGRPIILG